MPKDAMFTMKLEPELRDAFVAEAQASHRPASQVVRELMRQFIADQRQHREHAEFVQRKVDRARVSVQEGRYRFNDDVEGDFTARRAQVADQT